MGNPNFEQLYVSRHLGTRDRAEHLAGLMNENQNGHHKVKRYEAVHRAIEEAIERRERSNGKTRRRRR